MDNNYQSSAFEAVPDAVFPGKTTCYSAILAVKHTDNGEGTLSIPSTLSTIYNNVNRIVFSPEVYSLHTYPPRMLSMHHGSYSIDDISLADKRSGDLFPYNFHDFQNRCNNLLNKLLSVKVKDIFTMNSLYKRKKEVDDKK